MQKGVEEAPWLGPGALAAAPDGKMLFVACEDAARVAVVDTAKNRVVRFIPMPGKPTGLALHPDGKKLYVTCADWASVVAVVDAQTHRVVGSWPAGHTATAPVVSPDGKRLYICNRFNHEVQVIDLAAKKTLKRVPVTREPVAAAVTPDGRTLVVANHQPLMSSKAMFFYADVTLINTRDWTAKTVQLPDGSINLRGVAISPDGKQAFVTHSLGNHALVTMQVNQGWIVTSALSVIDLEKKAFDSNALLDNFFEGAADPWGIGLTPDGKRICAIHSGTHDMSIIARAPMLEAIRIFGQYLGPMGGENLIKDCRLRVKLPGKGPRHVALAGNKAYVSVHYSDALAVVDLRDGMKPAEPEIIRLGPEPVMSLRRQGEMVFHDATFCLEQWLSCASCHPDGRTDALNWDLLNDGAGTFKNTKSLLFAHRTPPSMAMAVRATAEEAVRAGFRHIMFNYDDVEKEAAAVDAYLDALRPLPSPHLADGRELTPAAKRGRTLFFDGKVGCSQCHPKPLYTDLRMHLVFPKEDFHTERDAMDTPTLLEVWRTAPYGHLGAHTTVKSFLVEGKHGTTRGGTDGLSEADIDALVAFVLSL